MQCSLLIRSILFETYIMFSPARFLAACLAVCGLWISFAPELHAEDAPPGPKIHSDIVYGHKDGLALTIDIIQPPEPSGAAVLWIQSGGWYSGWSDPHNFLVSGKPYLDRKYTLVIVRHGSAPRYQVPDAVNDVRRAVRYVRLKSRDYGIDASRLGVIGGSAGGHLTLMLATTGDDGDISSKDEVLRQGSQIAAAVAIFPPTDLRGFVNNPPQAIKEIAALKPPLSFDESLEASVSPILHVTDTSAPMLMIHGDRDELVPLAHSTNMEEAIKKTKAIGKLVVVKGAGHGFDAKQQTEIVSPETLNWFDTHLQAK
jgi:acetyl esterase/lipase